MTTTSRRSFCGGDRHVRRVVSKVDGNPHNHEVAKAFRSPRKSVVALCLFGVLLGTALPSHRNGFFCAATRDASLEVGGRGAAGSAATIMGKVNNSNSGNEAGDGAANTAQREGFKATEPHWGTAAMSTNSGWPSFFPEGERWTKLLQVSDILDKISSYDFHLMHQQPIFEGYYAQFRTFLEKFPEVSKYVNAAKTNAEKIGEAILTAANPELPKGTRATEGWFLTDAPTAFFLAAMYLLGSLGAALFLGLVCGVCCRRRDCEDDIRSPKGLVSKFISEPILLLQCLYNVAQVVLCSYMVLQVIDVYQVNSYRPVCNSFNASNPTVARLLWIFYASKLLDFCDTAFIILRRKWKQLTFLHIYHHATIFLFYWLNINVAYDGDVYVTILLNAFVHLVMYSYYLLRTLEIPVPQPIKQCVTRLQMIQFVLMEAQALYVLAHGGTCPFPTRVIVAYAIYILTLLLLFQLFSVKEYGASRKSRVAGSRGTNTSRRVEKLKGA